MVKQISLDTWSTDRLTELLKKGTNIITQTNLPIVLYRETLEEKEGSFEELICTLTQDHVVEQVVTSGGMVIPSIKQQIVFSIDEFPDKLLRKSKDRFSQVIEMLEESFS
jgi:hypothetical protein|tara:strand:+ start:413 stop:742 length:330 start_codon:yes stop_codon:yes gene_type:complete